MHVCMPVSVFGARVWTHHVHPWRPEVVVEYLPQLFPTLVLEISTVNLASLAELDWLAYEPQMPSPLPPSNSFVYVSHSIQTFARVMSLNSGPHACTVTS